MTEEWEMLFFTTDVILTIGQAAGFSSYLSRNLATPKSSNPNLVVPKEIKVDLMGGSKTSLGKGWINFDINAKSGIKAKVSDFTKFFPKNSVSTVVVNNPQAKFLNEINPSLKSGSTITIRGQMANKFFSDILNGKAEGLDNFKVISKRTGLSIEGYKRTDGQPLKGQSNSLNEIVLQKK